MLGCSFPTMHCDCHDPGKADSAVPQAVCNYVITTERLATVSLPAELKHVQVCQDTYSVMELVGWGFVDVYVFFFFPFVQRFVLRPYIELQAFSA